MNTKKQILKKVVVSFSELSLHVILDLKFLWLLLTPFLQDSSSGSPVFMQVDNFLTRGGLSCNKSKIILTSSYRNLKPAIY